MTSYSASSNPVDSSTDLTKDSLVVIMDNNSTNKTSIHESSCVDSDHPTSCPCHESKENQISNHNNGTTVTPTTSLQSPSSGSPPRAINSLMGNKSSPPQAIQSAAQPSPGQHVSFGHPSSHSFSVHLAQSATSSPLNVLSSPPNAPSRFFLNESLTKTSPMTSLPHQLSSSLPNASPLTCQVEDAVGGEEKDLTNSSFIAIAQQRAAAALSGGGKTSRTASQSCVSKKFHSSTSQGADGSSQTEEAGQGLEEDDEEDTSSSSGKASSSPGEVYRNKLYKSPVIPNEHKMIINQLKKDGFIRSEKVYQVMLHVNFANFGWTYSYSDASIIANELENCANLIGEKSKVLVINSWYYLYVPLCLSLMVGAKGFVVGHGDEGVDYVRKDHSFVLDSHRLILVDCAWETFKKDGFPLKAPYDLILVADNYFTAEIKDQLKSNGIAYDQVNNKPVFSHQP